jgi:hypothetical protein
VRRSVDGSFDILLQANMPYLITLVSLLLAAGSSSTQLGTFTNAQKLSIRQSDPLGQAKQPVCSLISSGMSLRHSKAISFPVHRRTVLHSCLNLWNQYLLQDCGQLLSRGH